MHELSVCHELISQVESVVRENHAAHATKITLGIGPLSGVEADLLDNAYTIARAGTVASNAELVINKLPVRIRCDSCGSTSKVPANRLVCAGCGDYRTSLLSGDELLLISVELENVIDTTKSDADRNNISALN